MLEQATSRFSAFRRLLFAGGDYRGEFRNTASGHSTSFAPATTVITGPRAVKLIRQRRYHSAVAKSVASRR